MLLIRFLNHFSRTDGSLMHYKTCLARSTATVCFVLFGMLQPAAANQLPVVCILPFKTDSVTAYMAAPLHSAILSETRSVAAFKISGKNTSTIWYDYASSDTISHLNLSRYTALCGYLNCTHLLLGKISVRNGAIFIETKFFSFTDKKFALSRAEYLTSVEEYKNTAGLIVKKISLYYQHKLPFITYIKISKGSSPKHVSLSWGTDPEADTSAIYRSEYEQGPFTKIEETESNQYCDTSASEGIKYWYRVCGLTGGIPGPPMTDYGYRKPEIPKGLTASDMLDSRNRPRPEPATPDEKRKQELHLKLYEKYYESYLMTSFITLVGRFYINSGELLAYRDIRIYSWDPGNRTIYFEKPGVFTVKFFSRRFFRFIRDMHNLKIPYDDLLPHTINNAIIFCIPSGEREIRDPDGRYRFVPHLEAVALGTEYTRDYEYWRSNSIFFATSDESIYKRIREVQVRGY
jgi:hypothetical protein